MTAFDHVPRIRGHSLETLELRAQHARIVTQVILEKPTKEWVKDAKGATKHGDPRKMRGVPIQAPGVGGTSPGTSPLAETLRRSR